MTKEELADDYVTNHNDSEVRRMYGHHYPSFISGYNEALKQSGTLSIDSVSGWLHFQSNKDLFNKAAKNNCKCKFEDGTVINYNDDHPKEIMTHFKLAYD